MTINPETAGIEVSFEAAADGKAALEDALALLNNASDSENRLIVVLDEFEEIAHLEPGTDELLCGVNHTAWKFVGLTYIDRTSDETTILHFKHFLEKHDFGRKIFALINERFNEAGLTHYAKAGLSTQSSAMRSSLQTTTIIWSFGPAASVSEVLRPTFVRSP